MSFSIERYKEESRKLDTTGVQWDRIRDYPLSKGDLFFLHYAMDVENHVPLYLSHLLVTRACMNPVITTFLSLWAYEELWHGENLSRFLVEYGIPLENDTRIRNLRSDMGVSNSLSILSTMLASWALDDFAALYLSIGACNELSTATAYGALARNCEHPVLKDLLARIQKDERRHFAFYYNSAKEWMTDNPRAQMVGRIGMKALLAGRRPGPEEPGGGRRDLPLPFQRRGRPAGRRDDRREDGTPARARRNPADDQGPRGRPPPECGEPRMGLSDDRERVLGQEVGAGRLEPLQGTTGRRLRPRRRVRGRLLI